MKAAYINATGPADAILYGDLPTPEPGPTQVLVKIGAVALNPVDTYIRAGGIAMDLPFPFVVGCDLAGTVEKIGADVTTLAVGADVKPLSVGTRVWGTNQGLLGRQGTFAEYAAVDAAWLYPTPDEVSDELAAAASLVGITAHLGLVRDAQLQPGETLLVIGGSGGVGSTVVQMAKAIGAQVITTAGSDAKATICKELGADHVINYHTESIADRVKEIAPGGVNVFWETRREPDFDLAVDLLASRGRMILMAGRDARPPFPVGPFYVKGCKLIGFVMFLATPEEQRHCAQDINRWLAEGKLKPRIDRVMKLSETAAAHKLQEDNTAGGAGTLAGKIVLVP